MPPVNHGLSVLGETLYEIQGWVDNNNFERHQRSYQLWTAPPPKPNFKGRSSIPHNNRKRCPVPPPQRGTAQTLNTQSSSPQRKPPPPHNNRPRMPTSLKPRATSRAPDHQKSATPRTPMRAQPFAGHRENPAEAQTPNKIYPEEVRNSPAGSSTKHSHPTNGPTTTSASNIQLLHGNVAPTSPQDKPMQKNSRKSDPEPLTMADTKPNTDYVPPHLRKKKSASPAEPGNPAPNGKQDYVPPHKRGRGGNGPKTQNASKAQSVAKPIDQPNGQAVKEGQSSEVKMPNVNGTEHNGENGDLMEVYRRPVIPIPKNVWTTKPGKIKPAPATPKKARGGKSFMTNKEIREAFENAPSPDHSEWANDEGWDKVFGPDEDDPNYDAYRLVDWEGNFLPCVDWTYREAFTIDPAKHKQYIQTWILRGPQPGDEPTIPIDGDDGEIATRSWAAINIDGVPLQDWWQEAVDCHYVEDGCVPWWTTFMPGSSSQLALQNVPDCKVNRKDWEHDDKKFLRDMGSENASAAFREKEKKKAEKRKREKQEYEAYHEAVREECLWEYAQLPRIDPKINLYVRFAGPGDMTQIAIIYDTIMQSSVKIPERDSVSREALMSRWKLSTGDYFPWLVAVTSTQNRQGGQHEQVLGFGTATDYHSIRSMYRYTAEIEVFVDPKFRLKGVGSCLMDRLMKQLTVDFTGYEGYKFVGDGTGMAERGGGRQLGAVVMNVPHDSEDHKDLEGISKFLSKFDMKQVGNLPGVGIKLKKRVDLAIFHAKVEPEIDPKKEWGL